MLIISLYCLGFASVKLFPVVIWSPEIVAIAVIKLLWLIEYILRYREEVSKLKEETRKYRNDLMSETRKLNLLERDNYSVKRDRDRAHSQVAKLNLEITRLKLKCGEEGELWR